MKIAGNLIVGISYQKLRVNFNFCFRHVIFQNQVYNFFVLFPGSFRIAVLSQDLFVFLLRISCHSNVSEKFDFCLTDFKKAIACLCMTHAVKMSTDVVVYAEIYLAKRHWLAKGKYITQLYSVIFIKIPKDFQYCILPRYA